MDAVFRAAADDQRVFDDVVALGLADGRLTARTLTAARRPPPLADERPSFGAESIRPERRACSA